MDTLRRYSRRTFVAWVGGASAGFYLFGRLPGMSAPAALAATRGRDARPAQRSEVPDAVADPAGHAQGGDDHEPRRQADRLLRDLDEAAHAADPPGGPPGDDGLGLRGSAVCEQEGPTHPQRALAHDRGAGGIDPSESNGSTISRTRTATSCLTFCRSTRRSTGPIRPAARVAGTCGRPSTRLLARTPALSRS